jgi:hypothetical protein
MSWLWCRGVPAVAQRLLLSHDSQVLLLLLLLLLLLRVVLLCTLLHAATLNCCVLFCCAIMPLHLRPILLLLCWALWCIAEGSFQAHPGCDDVAGSLLPLQLVNLLSIISDVLLCTLLQRAPSRRTPGVMTCQAYCCATAAC